MNERIEPESIIQHQHQTDVNEVSDIFPKRTLSQIKNSLENGELDHRAVTSILTNGISRIARSAIWQDFHQIIEVGNSNDLFGWYLCLRCNEPVENKYKGGTTIQFHRHLNNICLRKPIPLITDRLIVEQPTNISVEHKKN